MFNAARILGCRNVGVLRDVDNFTKIRSPIECLRIKGYKNLAILRDINSFTKIRSPTKCLMLQGPQDTGVGESYEILVISWR